VTRVEIVPAGPIDVELDVPGSKSITNRALVCAARAQGESALNGASLSDDSRLLIAALGQLGVDVRVDGTRIVVPAVPGGVSLHGRRHVRRRRQ
jgi:3-phosphoshikimate 1-carboxyvinyltransferase